MYVYVCPVRCAVPTGEESWWTGVDAEDADTMHSREFGHDEWQRLWDGDAIRVDERPIASVSCSEEQCDRDDASHTVCYRHLVAQALIAPAPPTEEPKQERPSYSFVSLPRGRNCA